MKLSTRSRYGVRLMVELALDDSGSPMFLKDIARKEEISEKYLSLIVLPLKDCGLVRSVRGAKGGYTLARNPSEITLEEIVRALEGDMSLVECVRDEALCPRSALCPSRELWVGLSAKISSVLASVTLEDLARRGRQKACEALMFYI